ncbi:MAG: hypothetical protein VW935_15315, partial [Novosphingobium sp.]
MIDRLVDVGLVRHGSEPSYGLHQSGQTRLGLPRQGRVQRRRLMFRPSDFISTTGIVATCMSLRTS